MAKGKKGGGRGIGAATAVARDIGLLRSSGSNAQTPTINKNVSNNLKKARGYSWNPNTVLSPKKKGK